MIKAVIFDLDDTLYRETQYIVSGFQAVADYICRQSNLDRAAAFSMLWEEHQRSIRGVFDRFTARNPDIGVRVPDMVACYHSHEPTLGLQLEVAVLLVGLREKYRLGLVSDGRYLVQRRKVDALKLDRYLDAVCLTDQWGPDYWKPNPRAFSEVCRQLGVDPYEACYVGDNLAKDFVGPNELGMYSVHLACEDGLYFSEKASPGGEPTATITRLRELPDVLAGW